LQARAASGLDKDPQAVARPRLLLDQAAELVSSLFGQGDHPFNSFDPSLARKSEKPSCSKRRTLPLGIF
jgi:hypothetical protein